jgi:hypothetical protein
VPVCIPAPSPSFGAIVKFVVAPDPSVAFNPVVLSVNSDPDSVTDILLIAPLPVLVIVKLVGVIEP